MVVSQLNVIFKIMVLLGWSIFLHMNNFQIVEIFSGFKNVFLLVNLLLMFVFAFLIKIVLYDDGIMYVIGILRKKRKVFGIGGFVKWEKVKFSVHKEFLYKAIAIGDIPIPMFWSFINSNFSKVEEILREKATIVQDDCTD